VVNDIKQKTGRPNTKSGSGQKTRPRKISKPDEPEYSKPPNFDYYMPQPKLPIFGFYKVNFIIYLIFATWIIIILLTPALEPPGSISFGDEGLVGPSEHYTQIDTFQNPFMKSIYHSGDQMCHQKESRSFIIFENQMSYCARCFGIFLGMAIGAGIATFVWIELKWWFIIGGLIPIGLDGGLQLITSYESNNLFRILTGSLIGIVTMIAVGLVIIEMSESYKVRLVRKKYDESLKKNEQSISNRTNFRK
jgi:uncharacterized membrane protein